LSTIYFSTLAFDFARLAVAARFSSNAFGLPYELLALRFTFSLGGSGSGILGGGESLDRSLWKISFTRVRRSFTTFGSPFLLRPSLQRLLGGFHD